MKQSIHFYLFLIVLCLCTMPALATDTTAIFINQVALDSKAAKIAIVQTDAPLNGATSFRLVNTETNATVFTGTLSAPMTIDAWRPGKYFYQANFSAFSLPGKYLLTVAVNDHLYNTAPFTISAHALATLTIPSIIHYYRKQRANTPQEQGADAHVLLYGSDTTVDIRGGWCDASGDVSKYFSHLAYTNLMSPQQIPLVTWSLVNTLEAIPQQLNAWKVKDSLEQETLWGADYLMRSLSAADYFYMTVFSYFKPDPANRRIVGLLANSVTTSDYQCSFREGGGMAIAALARIARLNKNGAFTAKQYLDGAKRAFAHLLINNTRYADDGKENILDDYCALMAATELWITTHQKLYRDEARKRAGSLIHRLNPEGCFMANNAGRPFWHASDAGLPVVALCRYLSKETEAVMRAAALKAIRRSLDYQLQITQAVSNPFGYARQSFLYKGKLSTGFFIPHENESGWWWQGENARLSSLATAALMGSKLAYNKHRDKAKRDSLVQFATQQLSWIMGCNPYAMCFLYGFGQSNVPYMASLFGHGSEKGGISNGITGKDGHGDGSGIDFKTSAEGNEWRWTEQWIPHAAWFLNAVTVMAEL